jgi:hypothetical protein
MAGRRSTYTPQIEVDGASTQQGATQATPTHHPAQLALMTFLPDRL